MSGMKLIEGLSKFCTAKSILPHANGCPKLNGLMLCLECDAGTNVTEFAGLQEPSTRQTVAKYVGSKKLHIKERNQADEDTEDTQQHNGRVISFVINDSNSFSKS